MIINIGSTCLMHLELFSNWFYHPLVLILSLDSRQPVIKRLHGFSLNKQIWRVLTTLTYALAYVYRKLYKPLAEDMLINLISFPPINCLMDYLFLWMEFRLDRYQHKWNEYQLLLKKRGNMILKKQNNFTQSQQRNQANN